MNRLLYSVVIVALGIALVSLSDSQNAARAGGKKPLKDLIVGKWVPEKAKDAKGITEMYIEFTKDSKLAMVAKFDEETAKLIGKKEMSMKGTYKVLDGDVVETTTDEMGKEKVEKAKVVISEGVMSVTPLDGKSKGKEEKFKRAK